MSKLIPTNRSNDCPVCGDISGKCRSSAEDTNYIQCLTNSSARKFEVVNGYKFIGLTKDNLWGQFVLETSKPQKSFEERQQLRSLRESLERQHDAAVMPVADRDKHYRAILSQLELHEADRADLLRRGFNDEQIVRYGFKSVGRWQPISGTFPSNLPGLSKDGSSLDNWHEGYLCPITTVNGEIQGFQIRNRQYSGEGAKYPWLSRNGRRNPRGYQAHLQNKELPVGIYWPDELRVFDTVALCEGFAIKPQVAANRLGAVVIACDSANFASRPDNFEKALKETGDKLWQIQHLSSTFQAGTISTTPLKLNLNSGLMLAWEAQTSTATANTSLAATKQQPITVADLSQSTDSSTQLTQRLKAILIPDGGDVANPHVLPRIERQFKLFAKVGLETKILWWGQLTKANGDVDEISRKQFEQAALISWTEFAAKVPTKKKPAARPQQQTRPSQTRAEWLKQQKIERDCRAYANIAAMLGIEAAINPDSEDYKAVARDLFYEPIKQQLKYETHGELVSGFAEEMEAAAAGQFSAGDAPRSLLAYDCSQGTGKSNNALIPPALGVAKGGGRVLIIVPTRGLAKEFKGRINERAGAEIAATHLDTHYGSAAIVVSCPESVYKFKGQKFELIQIDEANEVLHRIESAELGNAGPQSLAAFRKLLAATPIVTIATAAMSGRTLSAVQTIGGFTPGETQLQRRSRPATQMHVIEYGNFYQWLQQIIDSLRSGQRVAIPVGSRGKGRMIDRVLRATFPDKNGLVIDGASTLQNQRTQFLADPDAFLSVAQPDWFIFTPVINSGVSIEEEHFDIQFEYATPHEGAQSISQRGERIRSAIGRDGAITERHIYFSEQGAPTLEAYPDAFDWQYWLSELEDEANAPMGAAAALAKALGAEKALSPARQDAAKFAAMRPNLPHFMASKAFEIIFKKELLHEDWQRYGWDVSPAPEMDKAQAEQAHQLHSFCDNVRIGLIEQQGRTLKKTKTRQSEGELDEINNPFQAARAAKAQLERLLGKDYLARQDSNFFTAWSADKSASNPGVRAVVRSQLLQIAISDPECWQQIERMKALKFLAGKPDADSEQFWSLPELPAAPRDIELVSIVSRCPGVADVVSGKTEHWTNKDPQVVAAGLYLVAHGQQIAANTKRVGLMKGGQFTEKLAPTSLFNKALALVGHKPADKPKREGSGDRQNIHRLGVEADAIQALAALKADDESELKLFRAKLKVVRAQTRASIDAAARSQIISRALAWVTEKTRSEVHKAISAIKGRHAVLQEESLAKLGDGKNLDAEKLSDQLAQMALLGANLSHPPPI